MGIADDDIDKIRSTVSIVDTVQGYVALIRDGKYEKVWSLLSSEARQQWIQGVNGHKNILETAEMNRSETERLTSITTKPLLPKDQDDRVRMVFDLTSNDPLPALTLEQVLQEDHSHARRFDAQIDEESAFHEGQQVMTASYGHSGHTRLPQYARGRRGTIQLCNGAHVFPDLSAQGVEVHQYCYNVMFTAEELWPEAQGSRDKVYLDLWQSYLGSV